MGDSALESSVMSKAILMALAIILVPCSAIADLEESEETYRVYGSLLNSFGDVANSTSIKIDSQNSVWSENGEYEITGVSPGEHSIRAYFMNDGHTVVYRTIQVNSNMEVNFEQGKNWITGKVNTNPGDSFTLSVEDTEHSDVNPEYGFGPFPIGEYYTLSLEWERNSYNSSQHIHMQLQEGSITSPKVNHFEFHYGMNNVFGFISNPQGDPVSGAEVSNGFDSSTTNEDGFYMLRNLSVGNESQISVMQGGNELLSPFSYKVLDGLNWLNLSTFNNIELPHNATFTTQTQTVLMSPFSLEWEGGDYTDFYSLYDGPVDEQNIIYRGTNLKYDYTPSDPGTHEFNLVAHNSNGTNINCPSLLMIVLPNPSSDNIWQSGMSWDYFISHTPEHFQNRTYTVIGNENIIDAFGDEQETFLVRITDDSYLENEKSFRWFDAFSLLPIKTYWVDDPSSSSYFQEGTMGWEFTKNGNDSVLFSDNPPDSLHFNRTNIIGVPGHPNGYDDTLNAVTVTENIEINVQGTTYLTTYIRIIDQNDGVVSWELWYNTTARNYVKIIDRLPGSHSDSVTYELTGYEIPTKPKILTESMNITNNSFTIEWADFPTATLYQLIENEVIVYEGLETIVNLENKKDGSYTYSIIALTDIGYIIEGNSITIDVDFIPESPLLFSFQEDYKEGDMVRISWTGVQNAASYTVIVQDTDGNVVEIYNGSENFTDTSDLSAGNNRVRVNVVVDEKTSDYSPSEFVNIIPISEDSERSIPFLNPILIILTIICSSILISKGRLEDG